MSFTFVFFSLLFGNFMLGWMVRPDTPDDDEYFPDDLELDMDEFALTVGWSRRPSSLGRGDGDGSLLSLDFERDVDEAPLEFLDDL
jgi:hypothetical protein